MTTPLLAIADLRVRFNTEQGRIEAVRGVDLDIAPGERLAVVGESGSGKSQLFNAVTGLLARNGKASGAALFGGIDLLGCGERELNRIRGDRIGMVFQDPVTSLNPFLRIGTQLTEVLRWHRGLSHRDARNAAIDMLDRVRIPDAARRLRQYPHELSGGMRQRVMIAMALLCAPKLLIADEPTTALDVTIQSEILILLRELTGTDSALVIISHDLNLIAGLCQRVAVMYAGRIVEVGPVERILRDPAHPYTRCLLRATPGGELGPGERLYTIPGQPPDPAHLPGGCAFHPRCPEAKPDCALVEPPLRPIGPGHGSACPFAGKAD